MEDRKMYLFRVSHPAHGEIEVEASGRYFAVTKAAHEWGLRWSTIARDCRVEEIGEVSNRKKEIASSALRDCKPQAATGSKTAPSAPRNDRRKGGGRGAKADTKKQRAR